MYSASAIDLAKYKEKQVKSIQNWGLEISPKFLYLLDSLKSFITFPNLFRLAFM